MNARYQFALVIFLCTIGWLAQSQAQSTTGTPRLMQGPMLGTVTESSIRIWVRLSGPFECHAVYDTEASFPNPQASQSIQTNKETDYTATLVLENLAPNTRYYYRIYVNDNPDPYQGRRNPAYFQTAPAQGSKTTFKVAFGSCARIQDDNAQLIWDVVNEANPDLFFWLGDNMYGDALDPDTLLEEYRRQREVYSIIPILRTIPQLAVWDDHDYGLNDSDRTNPVKESALAGFKLYWPNPSYGLPDTPGVFFRYAYGGVDFFFLDVRYHRDPNKEPDRPGKTMLGSGQLAWLKEGLQSSSAPFKVLISGSGWSKAKGAGGDSWASYIYERDDLFEFIRTQNISGVVLLSGDTHVGELNAIPWSEKGGYDFYDLVSSPLAQTPSKSWTERRPEIRIRQIFDSASNIGLIEFDMRNNATLRFDLYDCYGESVWEPFAVSADELVNGVESWTKKIDAVSLKRQMQWLEGKGYYE